MEVKASCALELHGQAFTEVPPDMYLEVSAIVVGQGAGWDEPPVRGKDADLGELRLGDYSLLDVRDGHLPYANRPSAVSFRRFSS
jgi:hypothetical protein